MISYIFFRVFLMNLSDETGHFSNVSVDSLDTRPVLPPLLLLLYVPIILLASIGPLLVIKAAIIITFVIIIIFKVIIIKIPCW